MCVSCIQTLKEKNEKDIQVIEQAKQFAKEQQVTFGIYTDEYGVRQIARADLPGYPFDKFVSPFM
jgi:hypothetical protein